MEVQPETVGQALRRRRRALRLTQSDVAQRLGVSQSYIAAIERSERGVRWATVSEIARALELEVVLVPRERMRAVQAALTLQPNDDAPPLTGEDWS